jgi:hypothetical protein
MMTKGRPIPLHPVNPGELLEASAASGLSDDETGRLIDLLIPESLVPEWLVRRAVDIPTLRLLQAVKDVDDEQEDEPAWPPAPIEGIAEPLPGFEDVPERPAERRYPG